MYTPASCVLIYLSMSVYIVSINIVNIALSNLTMLRPESLCKPQDIKEINKHIKA